MIKIIYYIYKSIKSIDSLNQIKENKNIKYIIINKTSIILLFVYSCFSSLASSLLLSLIFSLSFILIISSFCSLSFFISLKFYFSSFLNKSSSLLSQIFFNPEESRLLFPSSLLLFDSKFSFSFAMESSEHQENRFLIDDFLFK